MSRALSDTPKSTPAYQLAESALKAYADQLEAFLSDEHRSEQMLRDQALRMHRWGHRLIAEKPGKKYPPLMEKEILVEGKLHPMVEKRLDANISHLYGRTHSAAAHIINSPEDVYRNLHAELGLAYELLKEGVDLTALSSAVKTHAAKALLPYSDSRSETKQLFEPMDAWFAWGQEFAIQMPDAQARLHNTLLIPQELTRAKWQFMVTLANAIYDIGFGDGRNGNGDDRDLVLISRMMERLSRHERGSDNPHMPPNCKLLHNPAIHSIHVVALAKKMFDAARQEIETTLNNGTKGEALNYLEAIRHDIMRAALLHDMGEMNGEISQGLLISQMTKDDEKVFSRQRDKIEHLVFEQHLDEIATKPDAKGRILYDEDNWKGNNVIQGTRAKFVHSFGLAERTDTFAGRLLKTLERMQSQQDYLRFEHMLIDSDYPKLHEPPMLKSEIAALRKENPEGAESIIKDKTIKNRDFSLNYVSSVFCNAKAGEEEGPMSLAHLAETQGNNVEKKVHQAIQRAVQKEYLHLLGELREAFHAPDYVIQGIGSSVSIPKQVAASHIR